ncbi:potassium channel family protein [Deinococcus apachensis]|uniref:potassium channel family protein n=1 Tax=Deinococcus apachensis TaxID=309886 RepID=UPI000377C1F1|nr:potassium channel family protein [Deinococcus apachensis]
MLRSLLWLPGGALILAVLLDLLASSMQTGEGRILRLVQRPLYKAISGLARWTGRRGLLAWSGGVLVVGTIGVWTLLTWLGWTLVFWSGKGALVGTTTETPADLWDVLYFVGYTLATLGLGDLKPLGNGWRLLTDLAALNGFFLITFAISFVVPVAQAQGERRTLALWLHRLGGNAQDLVIRAWHDHPGGLQGLVGDVATTLNTLDAQFKNSPALHRFHDRRADESLELALPALDEALSLIEHALDVTPPRGLRLVRDSISSLLGSYRQVHPRLRVDPPPLPDLTPLRDAGLPLHPDAEVRGRFLDLGERRRVLRAMTEQGGFTWSDVEVSSAEVPGPSLSLEEELGLSEPTSRVR